LKKTKEKEQKLNESGIIVLRYKDVDVMNNIENTPLYPLFLEGIE
jgi:very-short-patch-repair endonuclease